MSKPCHSCSKEIEALQKGLDQMTLQCDEVLAQRDQARSAAKDYRDKYCATILKKQETLEWEK